MGTILVATDGSPAAQAALATAIELGQATGDGIVLVTAWRELRGDFGLPYERLLAPDVAVVEREWAGETLAAAAEAVRAAGLVAESECRHGKPAHEICEVARKRSARLIVLGSHGFGPLEGLVLGSVSAGVLRCAPCPVVLVPEPATAGSR